MAAKGRRRAHGVVSALVLGVVLPACNAPKRLPEETRMYPKAPLEQMGPCIKPEPTTDMSRLAHLNKPEIVLIPAESVLAPAKK